MLNDLRENIFHCMKCGACRLDWETCEAICPSGIKYGFDSHYAIGRVSLARAVINREVEISADLMKRVYTCTSCGACDVQCNNAVGVEPLSIIEELKCEGIEKGRVPAEVRDFLENVNNYGNPWLKNPESRGEWAKEIGIDIYSGHEFLFYVGCVGSYDDRGQKIAQALGKLLVKAGVDFGILGPEEICDGNEVNRVGERGLFQELAERNIRILKDKGVKKVLTLSPHGFNAMKNDYPAFGGEFEVIHYTQLIKELIEAKQICFSKPINAKVTYHDPCFLGRHNQLYDEPRMILRSIPGLELIEMERNRDHALCCGGGGGNFITDLLGSGKNSPSSIRVKEAYKTDANILAVACPTCYTMLDDACKTEGFTEEIVVKDIAQLVMEAAFPENQDLD